MSPPEGPHVGRLEVILVMTSHHLPQSRCGFGGVIEWDSRDVVMHNMCLDGTVEDHSTNEAKVPVNG